MFLGYPLVVDLFSPRGSYFHFVCFILCPENLAWLSVCLGTAVPCWFLCMEAAQTSCSGPKNIAKEKWSYILFVAGALPTVVSSEGNCLNIYLTIFGSATGS